MDALIDDDIESLSTSLTTYLRNDVAGPASVKSVFALPSHVDEKDTESAGRSKFLLREIVSDMILARKLPYVDRALPSEPQSLPITPLVQMQCNHPRYSLSPVHADMLDNFALPGLVVVVDTPIEGRVRMEVKEVRSANAIKRRRAKSKYNDHMSEELARLKQEHPDLGHRRRFAMAVQSWKDIKASQPETETEADPGSASMNPEENLAVDAADARVSE